MQKYSNFFFRSTHLLSILIWWIFVDFLMFSSSVFCVHVNLSLFLEKRRKSKITSSLKRRRKPTKKKVFLFSLSFPSFSMCIQLIHSPIWVKDSCLFIVKCRWWRMRKNEEGRWEKVIEKDWENRIYCFWIFICLSSSISVVNDVPWRRYSIENKKFELQWEMRYENEWDLRSQSINIEVETVWQDVKYFFFSHF
jgi:hypothetical protein